MARRGRRDELTEALMWEARQLGTRQALMDQAVGQRLGIGSTDMQCLGVLDLAGPLTAGRMAALTGLTTGAVTGVVDRLEKAGFARRAPDPDDRRKVVVHPVPRRRAKVGAMYAPVRDRLGSWCAEHTEQELELVIDYLRASSEVLPDATEALRAKATASRTPGRA